MGETMTSETSKQFKKVLLFWLGSFAVVGIILHFVMGVSMRPIIWGGLTALAMVLIKHFVWPQNKSS